MNTQTSTKLGKKNRVLGVDQGEEIEEDDIGALHSMQRKEMRTGCLWESRRKLTTWTAWPMREDNIKTDFK
jgi:hypothetical protein